MIWIAIASAVAAMASAILAYLQYRHAKHQADRAEDSAEEAATRADDANEYRRRAAESAERANEYQQRTADAQEQMAKSMTKCELTILEADEPFQPEWAALTRNPQLVKVGWLQNTGRTAIGLDRSVQVSTHSDGGGETNNRPTEARPLYYMRRIGEHRRPGVEIEPEGKVILMPEFEAWLEVETTFASGDVFASIRARIPCRDMDTKQTFLRDVFIRAMKP